MRNYITFDGTDLRDYGLYISGSGVFNAPERVYNDLTVPGRNGLIIGNEKRLENLELVYPAFIYANFAENISNLRNFLLSRIGYQRLEDSYHSDEFRLALYAGGLEVEPTARRDAGQFEIKFNCKPQRYLKSGETTITLPETPYTLVNPTQFEAAPLIRVYGTGSLVIAGQTIRINTADTYTDIDCEIMEAYKGSTSCNQYITLLSNDFPTLQPGNNEIIYTSDITRVDITPRWWRV